MIVYFSGLIVTSTTRGHLRNSGTRTRTTPQQITKQRVRGTTRDISMGILPVSRSTRGSVKTITVVIVKKALVESLTTLKSVWKTRDTITSKSTARAMDKISTTVMVIITARIKDMDKLMAGGIAKSMDKVLIMVRVLIVGRCRIKACIVTKDLDNGLIKLSQIKNLTIIIDKVSITQIKGLVTKGSIKTSLIKTKDSIKGQVKTSKIKDLEIMGRSNITQIKGLVKVCITTSQMKAKDSRMGKVKTSKIKDLRILDRVNTPPIKCPVTKGPVIKGQVITSQIKFKNSTKGQVKTIQIKDLDAMNRNSIAQIKGLVIKGNNKTIRNKVQNSIKVSQIKDLGTLERVNKTKNKALTSNSRTNISMMNNQNSKTSNNIKRGIKGQVKQEDLATRTLPLVDP